MSDAQITTFFLGTHDFAATILQGLLHDPRFNIQRVITQPDRPIGRKQELQASPVKIIAQANNLTLEQPASLKNYNFELHNSPTSKKFPDLAIVAQYGLMIPKHIIESPKYGIINVHTSLLPHYRGASPIQSALIAGEKKTGVTIMLMDEGMDTGPILAQEEIMIDPDDTYESLDKKMAILGRDLLLKTVPGYCMGNINPQPQDSNSATICKKLDRDDGRVDWEKPAQELYNLYRGLYPWPGIWTTWNNLRVKLLEIRPNTLRLAPGSLKVEKNTLLVGCGDSSIQIIQLQVEGKNPQSAESFIAGYDPHNQNFV